MTRTNNFDALRLIGAIAVIVGHAYHLEGRAAEVPFVLGFPISTLGVVIFFTISGYLITASWARTPHPVTYLSARLLRIVPGLLAVAVVSVLIIGPWMTSYPIGTYLGMPRTLGYLSNIAMRPQYDLPGVFEHLPYPMAVNGSLWTLPAEFFCYLVVPVLLVWPRRIRPVTLACFLGVSLWLASVPAERSPVVYGSRLSDAAGMWVFFAAGALLRLAAQRWSVSLFRTDVAVIAVCGYVATTSVAPTWTPWIAWLALPYAVLAIGLTNTPVIRRAARFGDLSYGLYLWAFPVQQLVVHFLGVLRMFVDVPLVLVISLMLAYVSWHLIEHPSLRLKGRLAGHFGSASTSAQPSLAATDPVGAPAGER